METIKDKKRLDLYLHAPAFRQLFPPAIAPYALLREAEHGEYLIRQSEEPESLYYLVKGRCSVRSLLPNGKNIIVSTFCAPSLIGELEMLDPKRTSLSVRTLEPCELLSFPMGICRNILLNDVHFLRELCVLMGKKEQQSVVRLFRASAYPLENRLAAFVLEQREGEYFRVRKVHAAESLGVSYRYLETVLKEFETKGFLSKNRFVYHIEDEAGLARLAEDLL